MEFTFFLVPIKPCVTDILFRPPKHTENTARRRNENRNYRLEEPCDDRFTLITLLPTFSVHLRRKVKLIRWIITGLKVQLVCRLCVGRIPLFNVFVALPNEWRLLGISGNHAAYPLIMFVQAAPRHIRHIDKTGRNLTTMWWDLWISVIRFWILIPVFASVTVYLERQVLRDVDIAVVCARCWMWDGRRRGQILSGRIQNKTFLDSGI